MEFEKPYRSSGNSNTNSELFICFTSRPSFSSSASMKLASKPICSPGRSDNKFREHHHQQPTLSFSSSLNRRHGSNSMKAGQSSPMFKKRGCGGFENAEPSSPKVTCIGQVRVKTKKQGKKMISGILQEKKQECSTTQRNQKWVHLPLTICEALRGIGAEFNCFLPCGRSCSSRGRGEKRRSMSSCGAAFAKWLMALQDGEEEKGREIRVLVGEDEKIEEIEKGNEKEGVKDVEYEEGRLSICIPPKNALLLMRCRSEPLRMQALANRFWESPIQDEDSDDDENEEEELGEDHERDDLSSIGKDNEDEEECTLKEQCSPAKMVLDCEEEGLVSAEFVEEPEQHTVNETLVLTEFVGEQEQSFLDEVEQLVLAEFIEDQEEDCSNEEWGVAELFIEQVEDAPLKDQCDVDVEIEMQEHSEEASSVKEQLDFSEVADEQEIIVKQDILLQEQCESTDPIERTEKSQEAEAPLQQEQDQEDNADDIEEQHSEPETKEAQKERERRVLPDCLLMMLCEPKLSMEVSKETWVCSNDFIQPRSKNKDIKKPDSTQERNEKSFGIGGIPPCPAPSMASMIEQKLMKAVAYEPFVLKRCNSEPLRTSAKLVPEACFWNNPHVEPPPRVGF